MMKNKLRKRCLVCKVFYYKPSFMATDQLKRNNSHGHVYKYVWYNSVHRLIIYSLIKCFQIDKSFFDAIKTLK